MHNKELEIIKELMDKLSDEMEYGEEDFMERLGKKKPEVKVLKVEGMMPKEDEEEDEYEMPMDEAIGEHERLVKTLKSPSKEDDMMELEEQGDELEEMYEESPEDELKKRLLKLRS